MKKWLIVILLASIGFVYYFNMQHKPSTQTNTQTADTEPAQNQEVNKTFTSKLLFTGDVFWGRQVHQLAQASPLKTAFPFSGLDTFNKQGYQAWIGVLECPITDGFVSYQDQIDLLKFNCQPQYLNEVKKWFDIFTLASNHTDNMQEINGFTQTRNYLDKHSIQHFGHFDNSLIEDICEVVSIPIIASDGNEHLLPIALCGYNNVYSLPSETALAAIQDYSKHFLTIATPQQGAEYQTSSDQFKRDAYRKMIDYGADVVIGGQPHTVQETESYKGKLIVYSVGNFIFDQRFDDEVTRGIAIEVNLSGEINQEIKNYLELGEQALKFKDDVLKEVSEFNKPDIDLSFKLIAVANSGEFTKKGNQNLQNWALERTNWNQTIDKLSY